MLFTAKILQTVTAESTRLRLLLNTNLTTVRFKGFAATMEEALDKIQTEKKERPAKRDARRDDRNDKKKMKTDKSYEPRYRKWKTDEETKDDPEALSRRAAFNPADRVKRKKTALLLGYSGAKYSGMQRNPGMDTIEEELFKAMLRQKWITDEAFNQIQTVQFQRAARTDKTVSAARQVCSMKLADELDINDLNADLPAEIRLFALVRVTKGFNAKDHCNARTYTYTMPTIALAPLTDDLPHYFDYRIDETQLQKLSKTLEKYTGTKNFHNFTSRKNFHDPSANRFITSFEHNTPFTTPDGIEFVKLSVMGQSFMLHQIRKMVGLAIAIVRGHTTIETMERAFAEKRINIPTAPGLGLVLDTVHYERYNNRYGTDGFHKPLTWENENDEISQFAEKYIYSNIYEIEAKERPMLEWINTLVDYTYDECGDEEITTEEKEMDLQEDPPQEKPILPL